MEQNVGPGVDVHVTRAFHPPPLQTLSPTPSSTPSPTPTLLHPLPTANVPIARKSNERIRTKSEQGQRRTKTEQHNGNNVSGVANGGLVFGLERLMNTQGWRELGS